MKNKPLIIIGIIIAIIISVSSLIIIDNIEAQSKFPPLRDDPNAPDELRVILQLCEKPWEDRGLNQQYRNQTHHLDTHNCVWKYNFDKIDWSKNPTKKFEETSLRLVLHACSSWIESKNGREPLAYYNETHFINTKNCELEIIEKISINNPIFEMNRNKLSQVLNWCNDTSEVKYGFYNYSNETNSIDTKTCEWKKHVTFPNTDNLCVPYVDKWVTGEGIRNQTHIFDKDSCTWKIDQNYDTVNSKGCPQFCPKDTATDKIDDMQEIIIDENKGGNDYGISTNNVFSYSEYPTTRNLDAVLQSCERWERTRAVNFTSPDGTKFAIAGVGYEWYNSTHYIDNAICDFIPMKKHIEDSIIRSILEYCGSLHKLSYDNPYEYWFANETHYIDADTCLWQSLDDDIALVLPDHWKIVYGDD